jgi:rhodanese-related sulfurtransferase
MMPSAWMGLAAAAAFCGLLAGMFHHYAVRLFKARAWLSRGAALVDVDDEGEFVRHHPRVARNIPLKDLVRRARELGERDRPVVVFAHRWRRGAVATAELQAIGFRNVMNAAGLHTREVLSAKASRGEKAEKEQDLIELAPDA